MKKMILLTTLLCFVLQPVAMAQDKMGPADDKAMMAAWEAYATPGKIHEILASDNGSWTEEMVIYSKPDDPNPMKASLTSESKMVLGGRYQQTSHKGSMMGMPFEGTGFVGYDNASKKIVSIWMDNMGTGIMHLSGEYDGSPTMTLRGEVIDPLTGKAKQVRGTFTIVDDNTRKMEMFDTDATGKEYKSMEIFMKRKK